MEDTNQTLCTQDPGEGAVTPQETDPDMPMSVQESPEDAWVRAALLQGQGTECSMRPFEGGHHYLHYLHRVWPQVKQQGRNTSLPIQENWIKDLLNLAPPIRTRPSFPLSQSLPSGSFLKPLILLHQRADRMKTTVTDNSPN